MRILIAHNRYRSAQPSGENIVVDAEVALLRDAGHEVATLLPSSDEIGAGPAAAARAGLGAVWSRAGVAALTRAIREHAPQVLHLHNVYPLLSPWTIRAAAAEGVPVVQTVHNYRHTCVNGLHLRDGRVCVDCLGHRVPWPAVEHGCYRGSRAQSLPMAVSQAVHRTTWQSGVARFIALTPFQRDWLTHWGVPGDRITVRPSWVPDPGEPVSPPSRDVVFVGRLSEEKGIALLLEAWSRLPRSDRRLVVVGDGELAPLVRERSAADPSLVFRGRLSPAEVAGAIRDSGVVVVPSLCFEGYPLVIAEAFAHARPVLTVSGGATATIVGPDVGWVVAPTAAALASGIAHTAEGTGALGDAARARYLAESSPAAALESLLAVYRRVADGPAVGGA